ncbi:MAG: histidine phosphatase family protein [Acidiferrobacterales bacterium]
MIPVLLIRHGPTEWNVVGRIQGRTDVSLSADGRREVSRWCVPEEFRSYDWMASPLARALETATLLGAVPAQPDRRLAEKNWGEWEGLTWEELRDKYGDDAIGDATSGLDFRPPGGESSRSVQERFSQWLAEVARRGRPVAAVTHRGVIRAALAIATGWDMKGKPPYRLDWASAHLFKINRDQTLAVDRLNIGLASS